MFRIGTRLRVVFVQSLKSGTYVGSHFWEQTVQDVDWTAARELRRSAQLNVSVSRSDGTSLSVIVTDISRDGCQLRTDAMFGVGELIELKHELLGTLCAEVRWACAGRVGLQFARPI